MEEQRHDTSESVVLIETLLTAAQAWDMMLPIPSDKQVVIQGLVVREDVVQSVPMCGLFDRADGGPDWIICDIEIDKCSLITLATVLLEWINDTIEDQTESLDLERTVTVSPVEGGLVALLIWVAFWGWRGRRHTHR